MKFDAVIFRGDSPFSEKARRNFVRLYDLSLYEVRIVYNIVKRREGHGVFFYLSRSSKQ